MPNQNVYNIHQSGHSHIIIQYWPKHFIWLCKTLAVQSTPQILLTKVTKVNEFLVRLHIFIHIFQVFVLPLLQQTFRCINRRSLDGSVMVII